MHDLVIEREFPYRHDIVGVLFFFVCCGLLTGVMLFIALTTRGDFVIHDMLPPVRGWGAVACRWVGVVLMAALFFVCGQFTWIRLSYPRQRIAFTPRGILLPRNRWSTGEEFVEYSAIHNIGETEHYVLFWRTVTMVNFTAPQGLFSIARQKLSARDFEAVGNLLRLKMYESQFTAR